MKKFLIRTVCLLCCLVLAVFLTIFLFTRFQPEERQETILDLGNAWADIFPVRVRSGQTLTVHNRTGYAEVLIRIVDTDSHQIVRGETVLAPGGSADIEGLDSGRYVIQGKSIDDLPREYSFLLEPDASQPSAGEEYEHYFASGETVTITEAQLPESSQDAEITLSFLESSGPSEVSVTLYCKYHEDGTWVPSSAKTLPVGRDVSWIIPGGSHYRITGQISQGRGGYATFQITAE